ERRPVGDLRGDYGESPGARLRSLRGHDRRSQKSRQGGRISPCRNCRPDQPSDWRGGGSAAQGAEGPQLGMGRSGQDQGVETGHAGSELRRERSVRRICGVRLRLSAVTDPKPSMRNTDRLLWVGCGITTALAWWLTWVLAQSMSGGMAMPGGWRMS